jgi:hypothetical protein
VSGFFGAMMLFLLLRSFVELDLGGGFALTTVMLPVAWLYATSRTESAITTATPTWVPHPDPIENRHRQVEPVGGTESRSRVP